MEKKDDMLRGADSDLGDHRKVILAIRRANADHIYAPDGPPTPPELGDRSISIFFSAVPAGFSSQIHGFHPIPSSFFMKKHDFFMKNRFFKKIKFCFYSLP